MALVSIKKLIFLPAMDRGTQGLAKSILCHGARSSVGACQSKDCRSPRRFLGLEEILAGGFPSSRWGICPLLLRRGQSHFLCPVNLQSGHGPGGYLFLGHSLLQCPTSLQLKQEPALGPMTVFLDIGWGASDKSYPERCL